VLLPTLQDTEVGPFCLRACSAESIRIMCSAFGPTVLDEAMDAYGLRFGFAVLSLLGFALLVLWGMGAA